MTRSWRAVLGTLVTAGALVALAACGDDSTSGSSTTAAATTPLESVSVGFALAPPTLDITTGSGAAIPQALLYNVYETLVKIDDQGLYQPLLAKSYQVSEDGLTYTFKLRDNLKFASGQPLTSKDVKYSFDRAMTNKDSPPLIQGTFAPVASIEAPDAETVVITLKERSRNFLYNLTQTGGVVIEEAGAGNLAKASAGSGPYQIGDFVSNASLMLNRNENYWGNKPEAKTVTFKYFGDENALGNALKAGDVQLSDALTPEVFKQFEGDSGFKTVKDVTNGETIIAINNSDPVLKDPKVRQALSYAIDRNAMNQAAESGLGFVIGSHSSKNDPWFEDLSGRYPYDPEKAKALLKEAGHENLTLTMKVPPVPYASPIAQTAVSELAKVGVTLNLEQVDFPKWIDQVFLKGDYQLSVISHVEARDIGLYANPKYYWRYDDAQTQQLLADADKAPNDAVSNQLYQKAQERISDQAANVFLFLLPYLGAAKNGITGYPQHTYGLSYDVTGLKAG